MTVTISKKMLVKQFNNLDIKRGGVLVVHTAFSHVRPIEGGVLGLIKTLQNVITTDGTLVMPSMSWDDETVFNPQSTPCREMRIIADTFWRQPDVIRSDNPHGFAAIGLHAEHITSPQPLDIPHGIDSPVGRIYELDGQVLLLGIDQTANTTIHLAENMAGVRYRRKAEFDIISNGEITRFKYEEIDHCCQNFQLVDTWLAEQNLIKVL
jgi:aminoglycoside 3-N-acetyltransferase